ncbi:hypothetical protein HK098_005387 [Nowakowskiella sp. JEL0407]|nr:hypothetical protein HK098_005387 [Nowakowskiella sp. JEL0407]
MVNIPAPVPSGYRLIENAWIQQTAISSATAGCLAGNTCTSTNLVTALQLCGRLNCAGIVCPYNDITLLPTDQGLCSLFTTPIVVESVPRRRELPSFILLNDTISPPLLFDPNPSPSPLIISPVPQSKVITSPTSTKTAPTPSKNNNANASGTGSNGVDSSNAVIIGVVVSIVASFAIGIGFGIWCLMRRYTNKSKLNLRSAVNVDRSAPSSETLLSTPKISKQRNVDHSKEQNAARQQIVVETESPVTEWSPAAPPRRKMKKKVKLTPPKIDHGNATPKLPSMRFSGAMNLV